MKEGGSAFDFETRTDCTTTSNNAVHFMCCPSEQDRIPVMRGQWFIDGTWLPLEEDESDLIELEHLARFRGQQMWDTYELESVNTTVESKDVKECKKLDLERCKHG